MIDKNTTIKELALIVSTKLRESNIDTVLVGGVLVGGVLVGGAVVSIYTKNEYESGDLDFISYAGEKELINAMKKFLSA